MKKAYIIPSTKIVTVELAQMIASSIDGFNATVNETGGDGSSALSRSGRYSVWGDDEE